MGNEKASTLRQIGALIFNCTPSRVSANNLSGNTWIVEVNGVCVVGVLTQKKGSKFAFEITEGDRELVNTKYIV